MMGGEVMEYQYGSVLGATSFFIDTRWGCGGVEVKEGKVVGGAPIFKKFYGQNINKLMKFYKVEETQEV